MHEKRISKEKAGSLNYEDKKDTGQAKRIK